MNEIAENDNRPLIHHNREPSNSTQTVSLSSTYLPASSAEPPQNDNRITEAERQRIQVSLLHLQCVRNLNLKLFQLRPAGMILHINVVSDDEIELKWKRPEAFSEIKLSGSMVRDHLPFAMRRALKMKKIRNSSEIRSPNSLSEQPILLETL
jgi:hypothetical protein